MKNIKRKINSRKASTASHNDYDDSEEFQETSNEDKQYKNLDNTYSDIVKNIESLLDKQEKLEFKIEKLYDENDETQKNLKSFALVNKDYVKEAEDLAKLIKETRLKVNNIKPMLNNINNNNKGNYCLSNKENNKNIINIAKNYDLNNNNFRNNINNSNNSNNSYNQYINNDIKEDSKEEMLKILIDNLGAENVKLLVQKFIEKFPFITDSHLEYPCVNKESKLTKQKRKRSSKKSKEEKALKNIKKNEKYLNNFESYKSLQENHNNNNNCNMTNVKEENTQIENNKIDNKTNELFEETNPLSGEMIDKNSISPIRPKKRTSSLCAGKPDHFFMDSRKSTMDLDSSHLINNKNPFDSLITINKINIDNGFDN